MDKKKLFAMIADARGRYFSMLNELDDLRKEYRLPFEKYLSLVALCIQWNSTIRDIEEQLIAADSNPAG